MVYWVGPGRVQSTYNILDLVAFEGTVDLEIVVIVAISSQERKSNASVTESIDRGEETVVEVGKCHYGCHR